MRSSTKLRSLWRLDIGGQPLCRSERFNGRAPDLAQRGWSGLCQNRVLPYWRSIAGSRCAVREYLDTLDQAACGAASDTVSKFVSPPIRF